MHGRSFVAVIVAAVPALVFAASAQVEAFAEDVAAERTAAVPDPLAPPTRPVTTVAVPAPGAPPPSAATTKPTSTAEAKPTETAPASPPQASAASSPVPPGPVIEKVRAKLADPAMKGRAAPEDIAALQAFYATRGEPVWITPMGFTTKAQGVIDEIAAADDWGLSAAQFEAPSSGDLTDEVDEEAAAELKLSLAVLKYARYARGGRADPSAISNLIDLNPPLKDPNAVLDEIASAEEPDAYLRGLHPKHEQFQRLHEALLKARGTSAGDQGAKASDSDIQRIVINMERWRWMPENLGAFYVQDNVPEFMLYVVKDGKTIHADKIVVGKLAYATPIFSADMRSIVFNPEWTVPPTIVRENLLPNLRGGGGWFGGSSVLREHGLKVRYNGKIVDPGSINWSSVNMANVAFVQAPGPTNVLGKLKFLYPNSHMVYMHDTIKPNLFKPAMRAEGHNCIRMEKPARLAEILLAEDKGWDTKKIQDLLAKGYDAGVTLDKPFPVHTTYFTAVVDDKGKVTTFGDVYGLDRKLAAAVLGKSTSFPTVDQTSSIQPQTTTTAAVEPKPKKKETAAEDENLFDMAR